MYALHVVNLGGSGLLSKRKILNIWIVALLLLLVIPVPVVTAHSSLLDHVIKQVKTRQKTIALTFDDGPDPRYTPVIIEELQRYGAKGTFFVIGSKAQHYPDLIHQLDKTGNEIGNHTYSHRLTRRLQPSEILNCDDVIFSTIHKHTRLFRPPGGYISQEIVDSAKKTNECVVMWSWDEDSRDWSRPGVHKIVKRVLDHLHSGDIILFHDGGGNRRQTIEALPIILEGIKQQGFRCVTVSELLKIEERPFIHPEIK
jgi:peptidoglycan/xylan/chitin deacetylase (PgdA/CDA1 family)